MKFSAAPYLIALSLSATVGAAMEMDACGVTHNAGAGGNQFSMSWVDVPSQSSTTVCGHFNDQLRSRLSDAGMKIRGSITCATDGQSQTMITQLTLDKQSCVSQAALIIN